ncbi:MAG TPA: DUF2306 domain-containing protein [Bacillus sp. (in: firmicutes)]|nr:DUF2306 domain-containing protein [Bacillus sp. (in: firmicutes)]
MSRGKVNFAVLICYAVVMVFMVYLVMAYILHDPKETGVVSGKLENPNFPIGIWQSVLYFHIITGAAALVVGPFQFLKASRKKANTHRTIGKVYVSSIFLSVPAGVFLAFYATGGVGSTFAFLVLDVVWFASTFVGLKRIRQRNIQSHQEWMLRSYAVTLGFVTFRIFMPIFVFAMGLGFAVGFPLAVFVSLLINLFAAEWYVRRKRKAAIDTVLPA